MAGGALAATTGVKASESELNESSESESSRALGMDFPERNERREVFRLTPQKAGRERQCEGRGGEQPR